MSPPFGSWSPLCGSPLPPSKSLNTASPFPECNLIFRQLLKVTSPPALTTIFPWNPEIDAGSNVEDLDVVDAISKTGVGVGQRCQVQRAGQDDKVGDIAQIVASAASLLFVAWLIWATNKRRAAVGRVELSLLFIMYAIILPIQILTVGAVLEQGSSALAVFSAIHVGLIAGIFWVLLANSIVATQVVEDGTMSSLIPLGLVLVSFLAITIYIALDTAFGISKPFELVSGTAAVGNMKNTALFVLGLVWPAVAVTMYTIIMAYVVFYILEETRPLLYFFMAFVIFCGSQVVLILPSQALCEASKGAVNSGFIATIMETTALGVLYLGWKSITEDSWGGSQCYYP